MTVDSKARIPADLADRVLTAHPLPIADALCALLAADSVFEARDRVVEVFRAELRILAALVLASRLQLGPGPSGDGAQIPDLLRALRARGLTDGQWVALLRETLRPWASPRQAHPLHDLARLMHEKKSELAKLFDELLVMRKSETVAHGATGTRGAIEDILERRVPQLVRTLELLDPIWSNARLCLPLAAHEATLQSAWLLMGGTPHRGRFRKVELASAALLPVGEAVVTDREGRALIALHPIVVVKRPSPELVEEIFVLDGGTKRGATFVAFPSMSEHREADAWTAIEGALSEAEPTAEKAAVGGAERPYRGLAAFGPEDHGLFFGREEQAETLANRIRRNGFVTVTGPSGSGKTSLLRAGVLPLLRDTMTTFVRPGADGLVSLSNKLADLLEADRADLVAMAKADPGAFARRIEEHARRSEKLHVIVVDQGEEMLTLCLDPGAREAFGAALARIGAPDGMARVVFGVREDFFGRLATVPSLRDHYSRTVEVVTTPDSAALLRTLVMPAQAFGYSFEDPELVSTMVDEVADAPAALALLQFCADRLWEQRDRKWKRLTWDAYRAMGGVAGALASHADRVLAAMLTAERATCRAIFLRLVSGERTRTVLLRSELLDGLRDKDAGARALDSLIGARLVAVSDDASGQPTVELVHEALIKHWAQLDRWLADDEEGQRLAHAMRQAAREWSTRNRARDLVWRGDLLDELRIYRRRAVDALAGVEAEFAEACEREARRGRRIRGGLIGAALAISLGFGVFASWQWRRTDAARVEAESARSATGKEKTRAEIRGLVAEARGHEPTGRTGHAMALLRAASTLEQELGEERSTLLSLELERLERSGAGGIVIQGHTAGVYRSCIPSGRDRLVTASMDETTRIWELSTGRLLITIPSQGGVARGIACAPDGDLFALNTHNAKDDEGAVSLFSVDDGTLLVALDVDKKFVDFMEFTREGDQVVAKSSDGAIRAFRVADGGRSWVIERSKDPYFDYAMAANGSLIAATTGTEIDLFAPGGDKPLRSITTSSPISEVALSDDGLHLSWASLDGGVVPIVEVATGRTIIEIKPAGTLGVAHVQFSPGGKWLVTSGPRGMDVWEAATGARARSLRVDPQHTEFTFSPDGALLVTRRSGARADVWDIETGARLMGLSGHDGDIETVSFTADGRTVATGSYDKTAHLYDLERSSLEHFWPARGYAIAGAISSNGAFGATVDSDGGVRVVTSASRSSELTPPVSADIAVEPQPASQKARRAPTQVALAPDGARIAIARGPGALKITEIAGGATTAVDEPQTPNAIAWSPDGRALAVATLEGAVHLYAPSGARTLSLPSREKPANLLAFQSAGGRLAIGYSDGHVSVVSLPTGDVERDIDGEIGSCTDIEFSPDGASIAIADNRGVRWVDLASGGARSLEGHDQAILSVAFSPDGSLLATAAADQKVILHSKNGEPDRLFAGHTAAVSDVTFSADGTRLLTASADGTARVWDVALATPLDILEPFGADVWSARFVDADSILALGPRGVAIVSSAPADRAASLRDTGALTNLRVCRSTFAIVAMVPPPDPQTVWAPDELCPR